MHLKLNMSNEEYLAFMHRLSIINSQKISQFRERERGNNDYKH